jgi:hypothetical protein
LKNHSKAGRRKARLPKGVSSRGCLGQVNNSEMKMFTQQQRLSEDLAFARDHKEEFNGNAGLLRYVAALNPDATRDEFVAACVRVGYLANSSANRFRESRKFDCAAYGFRQDADGRLIQD